MDQRATHPKRNAQTTAIAGVDINTTVRTHTGPWCFTSARYSDRPSNPALRTRKTGMADCNAVPIPAIATPETANAAGAMQHHGSAVIAELTVARIGVYIADLPIRRRAVDQIKCSQSIDFPAYGLT